MINQDNIKANIDYIYSLCNHYYIDAGQAWYKDANLFCKQIANQSAYTVEQIAGILSALSPAVEWETNKGDCISLVKNKNSIVSTYTPQREKALAIRKLKRPSNTDIVNILHGPKTIAFYYNLLLNSNYVTIDRHMGRLMFDNNNLYYVSQVITRYYNTLSTIIKEQAQVYNLKPYELQAIIWLRWKNISYVPKDQLRWGF